MNVREKTIKLVLVALAVSLIVPFAAVHSDDLMTVDSFNATYQAYKAAVTEGNYERAVVEAKRAYNIGKEIFDEQSPNPPMLAFNYGALLSQVGNLQAAKPVLEDALDMYESRYGDDAVELIPTLMELGDASANASRSRTQRKLYDRALKLAGRHYGKDSRKYGELSLTAGRGMLGGVHATDARGYLTEAHDILMKAAGPNDPDTGLAAFSLGRLELARRKNKSAQTYFVSALASFEDPEKPASPIEMSTHAFLIRTYQELGQPEKADAHCRAIGRMTPADDDQEYFPLYRVAPGYPMEALRQGVQGYVEFEFTVDDTGTVRDVRTVKLVGHQAFEAAAKSAITQFRYAPRFVDGQPVATAAVQSRISFAIEQ